MAEEIGRVSETEAQALVVNTPQLPPSEGLIAPTAQRHAVSVAQPPVSAVEELTSRFIDRQTEQPAEADTDNREDTPTQIHSQPDSSLAPRSSTRLPSTSSDEGAELTDDPVVLREVKELRRKVWRLLREKEQDKSAISALRKRNDSLQGKKVGLEEGNVSLKQDRDRYHHLFVDESIKNQELVTQLERRDGQIIQLKKEKEDLQKTVTHLMLDPNEPLPEDLLDVAMKALKGEIN